MFRRMAAVTALMVMVVFAGSAAAQTYTTGSVGADDTTPAPGDTVRLTGSGCPPNSPVTFAIDGNPAGGTTSDGNGNFAGDVTAPTQPGEHSVTATCGSQVLGLVIEVGAVSGSGLPRTGSSSALPLTSIGVALLAVGGLFVLQARRRRVRQPA